MYTYDDTPGDKELKNFTIAHDLKDRIPFIKRAQAAAKGNLRLFASPWSPPAWMKTNGDMLHGGKLKPEYARLGPTISSSTSRPMPRRASPSGA